MQKQTNNGSGNTLRGEFDRGYRQMIDAGVSPSAAKDVMKKITSILLKHWVRHLIRKD
jgi:hypothetical protein